MIAKARTCASRGAAHTGDDRGDERCGSEQPERQGEREVLCDAQGRSRYQPRDPRHESGLPSKAVTTKVPRRNAAPRDRARENHESVDMSHARLENLGTATFKIVGAPHMAPHMISNEP